MTDSQMAIDELIAQGRALLARATPRPWLEPHFGDSSVKCECRSIVSECYAGAIATIEVNNGLSIGDGGNDAPPYDEAVANGRLICFAINHLPRLLDELEAAWLAKGDQTGEQHNEDRPDRRSR